MTTTIYIADDEDNIRQLITSTLQKELPDCQIESFETGDQLLLNFFKKEAQLVILDVMMPGSSGFEIANSIREQSSIPIILLTARDSDKDFIDGFESGIDDYLTKPFSPIRLALQVKTLLKKNEIKTQPITEEKLAFKDLCLSPKQRSLFFENQEIKLTGNESQVLKYLMDAKGLTVSREELLDKVWGIDNEDVQTRVTDDTIKRLRQKLRKAGSNVIIETVWGLGFKLSEKPQQDL